MQTVACESKVVEEQVDKTIRFATEAEELVATTATTRTRAQLPLESTEQRDARSRPRGCVGR